MQQCHERSLDFIYMLYFFSHQEFQWAVFSQAIGHFHLFPNKELWQTLVAIILWQESEHWWSAEETKPALYFLCWRNICFFRDVRTDFGLMPCSLVLCSHLETLLDFLTQMLDTSIWFTYHAFRWIQSWRVVSGGCFCPNSMAFCTNMLWIPVFSTLFTSYLTALHLPLHGKKWPWM